MISIVALESIIWGDGVGAGRAARVLIPGAWGLSQPLSQAACCPGLGMWEEGVSSWDVFTVGFTALVLTNPTELGLSHQPLFM